MPVSLRSAQGVVYLPDSNFRSPFSVVWTTLPGISLLFPVIGHVGICDSSGVVYDFSGPYQITVGSLMCGPPKRIWHLDTSRIHNLAGLPDKIASYDAAVEHGARLYGNRMHNLVMDNCHSHVACVLNHIEYDGRTDWNQFRVFMSIWLKGQWVDRCMFLRVFIPWLVFVCVIVAIVLAVRLTST